MELQIQNLRKKVIESVNDSAMPLSLVYYVLNDILIEVSEMRKQELIREQSESEQDELVNIEEDLNL